jgi:hypothetical protein
MEGVTTAAVVFIFVCIAFPRLIRRRTQYYGAVTAVLLILLLGCADALIDPKGESSFHRFFRFMMYLLDFAAVLLLIMCSGGLSPTELFGEMSDAFSELRHGPDANKPVIVPLTGEKPRPRAERVGDAEVTRHTLDAGGGDDVGG